MSEEVKEQETTEVDAPETEQERWEIEIAVDEAIAAGKESEFMKGEYVYEFKQGGRLIRGLTASAIAHLALVQNVSIEDYDLQKGDDAYFCTATAVKLDTEQKAIGVAEQPLMAQGRPDVFAAQKCLTKACRNARKQLIPFTVVLSAIDELLVDNAQPPQQQLPPPYQQQENPQEDPVDVARKHMFAKYNEKKGTLLAMGITEDIFKQGLYDRYEVESRADMTEVDYRNAASSLDVKGNFAKWIRDLAPTADGGGGEEESEEDVPF